MRSPPLGPPILNWLPSPPAMKASGARFLCRGRRVPERSVSEHTEGRNRVLIRAGGCIDRYLESFARTRVGVSNSRKPTRRNGLRQPAQERFHRPEHRNGVLACAKYPSFDDDFRCWKPSCVFSARPLSRIAIPENKTPSNV